MSTEDLYVKAQRLVSESRILHTRTQAFEVEGDHGRYTVLIPLDHPTDNATCSCPAVVNPCSHILAVWMTMDNMTNEKAKAGAKRVRSVDPFARFDKPSGPSIEMMDAMERGKRAR